MGTDNFFVTQSQALLSSNLTLQFLSILKFRFHRVLTISRMMIPVLFGAGVSKKKQQRFLYMHQLLLQLLVSVCLLPFAVLNFLISFYAFRVVYFYGSHGLQ
jgi:hypothetical protein